MAHRLRTRQLLRLEIGVLIVLVLGVISVLLLADGYYRGSRQAGSFWPLCLTVVLCTWMVLGIGLRRLHILARDLALSCSDVRFRHLAESIDEALWLTAPDGSETFYANQAYERITGHSVQELYADPQAWRRLVLPEDAAAAAKQLIWPARDTEAHERGAEIRLIGLDQQVRRVWLRTRPVSDGTGTVVALAGVMVDITNRANAELAIEAQWAFLQAVVDGLPDALVVFDRDQRVVMANRSMQRWYETKVERCNDVCGHAFGSGESTSECTQCPVTAALRAKRTVTDERTAINNDGSLIHLEISASPILDEHGEVAHVITSYRDITDRRRVEDAVRESETRLRHIFENSPVSKLLVNENGVITDVNNRFMEKTGFLGSDVIGRPFGDFLRRQVSVEDSAASEPIRLGDMKDARNVNACLTIKSGQVLDVQVSGNQTLDPAGGTMTLVVLRDVTEQKQAERIGQYRLQLEQLLARVSTRFINMSATEMDRGITAAIADTGAFLRADHLSVMLYHEQKEMLELAFHWSMHGVPEQTPLVNGVHLFEVPWLAREFGENRAVVIHDVDEMAPEADKEQQRLRDLGVRSIAIVPLTSEGKLIGCLCARSIESDRRWAESDTGLLRMISEMISSALIRKWADEQLQSSQLKYRRLATGRKMLLEELNHRVLNNLTSLMTLVTMMERSGRSTSEFVEALRSRLGAFTAVHQIIAGRGWQEVDLRALLQNLVGQFEPNRDIRQRIEFDGPVILMTPKTAQTIAVIVQELLTNCRKYGAHSVPGGTVRFAWEIAGYEGDHVQVNMVWTEEGGPRPDRQPVSSHGLGIRLVRGFVSFELRGHCDFDFMAKGLECRISCTLDAGHEEDARAVVLTPEVAVDRQSDFVG